MEERVEIARQVAERINQIEGISTAGVDDYNKYGSFQIVAYLDLDGSKKPNKKNFSMSKITREIKNILQETKEVSKFGVNVSAPQRLYDKYTYRGKTDCYFKGYERSYVMVDFIIVKLNEQVSITELLV